MSTTILPQTVGDVLDEFWAKIIEGMTYEELLDYLKIHPGVFGDAKQYRSFLFREGIVHAKVCDGRISFVQATGYCRF